MSSALACLGLAVSDDAEFDVLLKHALLGLREIGTFGGVSVDATLEFGIFPKASDKLLATGEVVWVYVDQRSHKTVTIPAWLRELIATRDTHLMA